MINSILRVLTGDLIAKLASFISFLILTWSQSQENVALFVMANSIIAICLDPSATFAIQKIVNDKFQEGNRLSTLRYTFLLGNITSVILVLFYSDFDSVELKLSVSLFIVLTSGFIYRRVYWQSKKEFGNVSRETIYRYIFVLIGVVALFVHSNNYDVNPELLYIYISILMTGYFLFICSTEAKEKSFISWGRPCFSKRDLKIISYLIVLALWGQIDILYSSVLMTEYDTVVMATALRFYSIFVVVISSMNTVILPNIHNVDKGALKSLLSLVVFFLACVAISILLSPTILPILTNGNYPESVACFQILSISLISSFFAIRSFNNLLAYGMHIKVIFIFVFSGIVKAGILMTLPLMIDIDLVYILSLSTLISITFLNVAIIVLNKFYENSTFNV
ncbi:hypothetical protein AB6C99_11265 [Vibrio cyclitrophicus]